MIYLNKDKDKVQVDHLEATVVEAKVEGAKVNPMEEEGVVAEAAVVDINKNRFMLYSSIAFIFLSVSVTHNSKFSPTMQ